MVLLLRSRNGALLIFWWASSHQTGVGQARRQKFHWFEILK